MMVVATAMNVTESMKAQNDLRRAIELMQDGKVAPAVDMFNRLVAGEELDEKGRAAAYVWLAESRDDGAFKIRCLEQALKHDPNNQQIRQGLQQVMAAPPSPRPAAGPALRRAEVTDTPTVVGILGGRNGPASGVFINDSGMVATTSYAIGSASRATVMLDAKRHVPGTVVRRIPAHDLALIKTALRPVEKPSAAPPSTIGEGTTFIALGYGGAKLRGFLGRFNSRHTQHWLRTSIPPVQMPDAGGNPLVDENGQLLAMLTRNIDDAGKALAILMSHIASLAAQLTRDHQLMPDSEYCAACGGRARARLYGGGRCETCGAALGGNIAESAAPPQADKLAALFGENAARACPRCGARVGDYDGRCLRCGQAMVAAGAAERL